MKSALLLMALCLSIIVPWTPLSFANQGNEAIPEVGIEVGSEAGIEESIEAQVEEGNEESTEQIQVIAQEPTTLYINSASVEEIAATLPGIGVIKAKAIVALREKLDGFTNIDQLLEVKGIGFATLERISELIVIE